MSLCVLGCQLFVYHSLYRAVARCLSFLELREVGRVILDRFHLQVQLHFELTWTKIVAHILNDIRYYSYAGYYIGHSFRSTIFIKSSDDYTAKPLVIDEHCLLMVHLSFPPLSENLLLPISQQLMPAN
jgi:hypothetical protein